MKYIERGGQYAARTYGAALLDDGAKNAKKRKVRRKKEQSDKQRQVSSRDLNIFTQKPVDLVSLKLFFIFFQLWHRKMNK